MCLRYCCRGCQDVKVIYCGSADWNQVNPDCHKPTIDPEPHIKHKKCYACHTVEGAIRELQTLVFQKPWLETEGLAGEESRPVWERDGLTDGAEGNNEWQNEYNNQLVAKLRAMGLGELDGREELNDGHGIGEATNSNGVSPTDVDHYSGSDQPISVWGSDQSTWTSEGTQNGETSETQEMEEIVQHNGMLNFVENYFE